MFIGYNHQESLENTINTTGTLLGVHPIVPWVSVWNPKPMSEELNMNFTGARPNSPIQKWPFRKNQPQKCNRKVAKVKGSCIHSVYSPARMKVNIYSDSLLKMSCHPGDWCDWLGGSSKLYTPLLKQWSLPKYICLGKYEKQHPSLFPAPSMRIGSFLSEPPGWAARAPRLRVASFGSSGTMCFFCLVGC